MTKTFSIHQSLPKSFLLLVLQFFMPASSSSSSREANQTYSDCSPFPFQCGKVQHNISYPFWTKDYPTYCSYKKRFEIKCNQTDNSSEIVIQWHKYHVEKINYENQTFTIVDKDYFDHNKDNTCLRPSRNTTLNALDVKLFDNYTKLDHFEGDGMLLFLYNCSNLDEDHPDPFIKPLKCPSVSDQSSSHAFYASKRFIDKERLMEWGCQVIEIPILRRNMYRLFFKPDPSSDWNDVLREGFDVTWSAIDPHHRCWHCVQSNGHCGYNVDSPTNPTCYCKGQQHLYMCPPAGKHNGKKKQIIIGAAVGVGSFLCLVACIILYYRKKCFSLTSSKLLSRAISLNPSLKSDLEKSNSLLGTQFFDYKELEEATNNFDPSKELGDGGFGVVYHGKLRDGRNVAVKRLYENNCRCVEQFKNEIKILSHLRHQNLVTLYGCSSRHSRELLLVYEFIPNGTVADHLHGDRAKPGVFTWPTRMGIAIETADALKYLHAVDIIHRDVKTNNVLLDNNFHVKVADFGLSRLFPTDVTHVSTAPQGTPGYVDPDYRRCYQLTDKSDVYSFGVVLMELISSKPAVDITRHRHEINLASMAISKIVNSELNELVDPTLGFESDHTVRTMITSVAGLAFRCLQDEKEDRPPMEEVFELLRGIASEEYNVEKVEEVNTPADDEVLLKKMPPLSPDAVSDAWESRISTPNTSG